MKADSWWKEFCRCERVAAGCAPSRCPLAYSRIAPALRQIEKVETSRGWAGEPGRGEHRRVGDRLALGGGACLEEGPHAAQAQAADREHRHRLFCADLDFPAR
jgi:hypothetical protein